MVPFIGSEEEKMEQETQKILGTLANGVVTPLKARVSAHCNRVAVTDGHLVTTSIELSSQALDGRRAGGHRKFSRCAAAA